MRNYPNDHREIVSNLLDGRFVVYPVSIFTTIQSMEDEYKEFFRQSYGFELHVDAEIAYLTSNEVSEKRTRDFTLFLAVLCRELDYSGKNFKDAVELSTFQILETEELLKKSTKWEILEKTSVAAFDSFIETWHRKNVVRRTGNTFRFTKAVKIFFEFAVNVAKEKLKEQHSKPD